jgi:predicted acetyltransferase
VNIELVEATPEHKSVLGNLMELYQYDFTEYTGEDVGDDGRFGFDRLDAYFGGEPRHAFLLRVDGAWAGLTLLHRGAFLVDDPDMMDVVEFFVMRKYRRKGVASEMARRIFGRFPGRWEVRVMQDNTPAQAFWRRIIGACTDGRFEERPWHDDRWLGPVFFFDNSGPRG